MKLLAQGPIAGSSKTEMTLDAPSISLDANEITLTAAQKITLIVGPSSVTIDQSGVHISGPQVNSSAIGTHNISGALIKLN
jgi:type VI secretion system secreted protein VgrG